ISKAIADMEHTLGVRLLDRSPLGVEPTIYARALLDRGLVVFDELKQALKHITFLADPAAGELRVGANVILAVGFVAAVIDRLSRQYPRIVFHLEATDPATALRALRERRVDLAVVHHTNPLVDAEPMCTEFLYDEQYVVVAGAQNPGARGGGIALPAFENEPWTLPPRDSRLGSVNTRPFRS